MRFIPIIALLFWASVITVRSQTPSTIWGPSQGNLATSSLMPEDCLSTINLQDIVFLSAVPIAVGFGLLLLLASLQDLRQARKSNHSCPPSPCNIRRNRARKERTYVIDVDYAGRSRWGSFLRWFAMHKSPSANQNPHLLRLQGTIGFSDWLSIDLIRRKNSEQKTLTTPRSIGKLVAVETKSPSASDGFTSRLLQSSNIGSCLRGIVNRACDIEIKQIRAVDTKTQDHYIAGCASSSGGVPSSDQGITTILPLLLSLTRPVARLHYIAYFFQNGSLWTSAFTPWRQGNFTGSRRITCLFACVGYTMVAARVVPKLVVHQSMEDVDVVRLTDVSITAALLVRALVVATVVFALLGVMETIFRGAPTIWSLYLPCASPRARNENRFMDGVQPTRIQSAAGDFYDGSPGCLEEGLPRISISAPAMQRQGSRPNGNDSPQTDTASSCFDKDSRPYALTDAYRQAKQSFDASKCKLKPVPIPSHDVICRGELHICAADQPECHHKLTCYKCPVCHLTTGSKYYNPGAGCSGDKTSTGDDLYNPGGLALRPGYAYSSSSLDSEDSASSFLRSKSTMANLSKATSFSDSGSWSVSDSISDSTSITLGQPLDQLATYNNQGAINAKLFDVDNPDNADEYLTAPSVLLSKEPSQHGPDSISRATSTSGLLEKTHKTTCKQEAGDRSKPVKHLEDEDKMKQEDMGGQGKFIQYTSALLEPDIKMATVMRIKNYINRFSDMGKGKVVNLLYDATSCDVFPSQGKLGTKKVTDNFKPKRSVDGPKVEEEAFAQTPCGTVTTGCDYIINLPLEFEMPSVTIQNCRSNKPFFFNFRKWLSRLRSEGKVNISDNYTLEVTEDDVAFMKTSDESIALPCSHDVSTIQIEEETKHDTILRYMYSSPEIISTTLADITDNDTINTKTTNDHLKRSIFQSSSRLIEYRPDVIGVASSGSWSSIASSHSTLDGCSCTPWTNVNATNENNNSQETATINMDIPSSSTMPCTSSSDEYLSLGSSKTSSSSVPPKSTSSEGICSSKDISSSNGTRSSKEDYARKVTDAQEKIPINTDTYDTTSHMSTDDVSRSSHVSCSSNTCRSSNGSMDDKDNPRWNRYKYYQAMHKAVPTVSPTENHRSDNVQPIMFLILHIALIASCVLAVLWSVSSFHGLCWRVLWEWLATSVIAILIQAVILDATKASVMIFILWWYNDAKPRPYSTIH